MFILEIKLLRIKSEYCHAYKCSYSINPQDVINEKNNDKNLVLELLSQVLNTNLFQGSSRGLTQCYHSSLLKALLSPRPLWFTLTRWGPAVSAPTPVRHFTLKVLTMETY